MQSPAGDDWFDSVPEMMERLAETLNSFMQAPSDQAAREVLRQHPELHGDLAYKWLRKGIDEARNQGYPKEAERMSKRLVLLDEG
ncbi:hypothetical protein OIE61_14070 [Streptomyces sp. NBC_01762]|uniref:hypothetical protein n=1 Tax=unclassified Streptomyces TaxID=2593676 RepID=UPI002DDA8E70|nr:MULTISPECIES: hypothetical protein [unclassified Streptomyces]WSC44990.1 hypothetical protein OIE61_14070 [Streptomyces sp. NBC_01762]WSD24650.1 hypothetical protein OHA26_14805 [Streptomyces sp. NBC_01751]